MTLTQKTEPRFIYLDHHATTPLSAVAREAMESVWQNWKPPPVHMAPFHRLIGTAEGTWRWTHGATDANARVLSTVRAGSHLITSAIEHASIGRARLSDDVQVTVLPVDEAGHVDVDQLRRSIRDNTALISVGHVNNEVGTIQRMAAVGAVARAHRIPFHTDAAQSPVYLNIPVDAWGLDFVSLSPHKFYGPKGIGLLWVREGVWGDDLAVPAAATADPPAHLAHAAVAAMEECLQRRAMDTPRVTRRRDQLWAARRQRIPEITLNGAPFDARHPGNLHLSIACVESSALLRALHGQLALSAGSACASSHQGPSHVLRAMGLSPERTETAIRLCVGRDTTEADIEESANRLAQAASDLRSQSPLWQWRQESPGAGTREEP